MEGTVINLAGDLSPHLLPPPLTLAAGEVLVVADGAEILKHEDSDGHHGEAHHEHHDPHGWAVRLCKRQVGPCQPPRTPPSLPRSPRTPP